MDEQAKAARLRVAAETRLKAKLSDSFKGMDSTELPRLVHELQVHQIELEIQNEELRSAQKVLEQARDNYFDLYELAPVGYITLNREAAIGSINLTAARMLGVDRSKLMFRGFSDFVTIKDKSHWYDHFLAIMSHPPGMALAFDLEMVRSDGVSFQAHIECLRREDTESPSVFRLAIFDVSKLKRVESDLRVAAAAFEAQEGILVTDAIVVIMRVNQAFTTITGYSAEEVIGKKPNILQSGRQDAAFYAAMWQSINTTGGWSGEIWNKRKNGEVYPEHLAITAVKDVDGAVTNYIATLTDITINKVAADTIQHLAFYDSLTGLPNRQLLLDRLNQALASSTRSGKLGALLFIDLDNFKDLNDTRGHDVGDLLLKQVADRLTDAVREGDTVARLGGDEFVLLLEDLSEHTLEAAAQAESAAKKIIAMLNEPYQLKAHEYHSTPSIGATLFNDHERMVEELLKQADIAMYEAKSAGRNTIRFFDPEMQAVVTARTALETALRKALPDQFQLHYQLQADSSGQISCAEALIRWLHPETGMISPATFIPIAEESGLILPIGHWVLVTACRQLKAWESNPKARHLKLAVNVSAKQFEQKGFVAQVLQVIEQTEADPAKLKLELTESLLVDNVESTIEKMNELKANGISFSLDDFGTGFSSLSSLKRLPLDQLKIDQSFVHDMMTDPNDAAIVRMVIALGQSMGIAVIAEGVETEEQKNYLAVHGCNHYQGYFFSKPVPVDEFEKLLSSH